MRSYASHVNVKLNDRRNTSSSSAGLYKTSTPSAASRRRDLKLAGTRSQREGSNWAGHHELGHTYWAQLPEVQTAADSVLPKNAATASKTAHARPILMYSSPYQRRTLACRP
ncbi:uncharacterized protein BDW70DRAFT_128519 [Aspergillus foveolatus]|uniref:uncharacterized protein n=1 Tax=Aspergillus foveolatus TaxID=210207 RepID=UPI003CCE40DD